MESMNETTTIEPNKENRKQYTRFLVTTAYGWGFGTTLPEAKKNARKEIPVRYRKEIIFRASLVDTSTVCRGDGSVEYHSDFPPIQLGEV